MAYVLYILGRKFVGWQAPFTQQFLVEYDPGENNTGPQGTLLKTSPQLADAQRFPTQAAAAAQRYRIDADCNWRWDQKPNSPLLQLRMLVLDENQAIPTPPVISNVVVQINWPNNVTISWATDQPTTDWLDYGLDAAYGFEIADTNPQTSTGQAVITGDRLHQGGTYHYAITSMSYQGPTTGDRLTTSTPDATFVWDT
jgi:hypothetical protein